MKYFQKISTLFLLVFTFLSLSTQTISAKTAAQCEAEGRGSATSQFALCLSETAVAGAPTFQIAQPKEALTNIPGLIGFAVQILFIVAGLVAFVYLLLGGIKWITSGGDKGQVEAARNQIIQALIGLVVVFLAWGLIVLIEKLFGLCLGFSCAFVLPDVGTLRN